VERNIILAGVGGQGILSIAYVIDNAALEGDLHFKQAEVHGMAQRGGAVQSHLRIADHPVRSDLIPEGAADLILSVEPLEALRYLRYLRPDGVVVAASSPHVNIPDYPPIESVHERLLALPRVVLVDADRLARRAGTPRASNMVLLGAATDHVGLPPERLERWTAQLFARKGEVLVARNVAAFRAGRAVSAFFTACVDAGMSRADTLALTTRLAGSDTDLAAAPLWAAAFAGPHGAGLRQAIAGLADEALIAGDRATAERAAATGAV
jgi:indolepyruvate ferredoxin oxidoreductase beta subunit